MYIILWEFQIKAEKLSEFEEIYSPNGAWTKLFRNSQGFLGTELLHDEENIGCYLTIDRWESEKNYDAFQAQWRDEKNSIRQVNL